jgi:hypothetical protein
MASVWELNCRTVYIFVCLLMSEQMHMCEGRTCTLMTEIWRIGKYLNSLKMCVFASVYGQSTEARNLCIRILICSHVKCMVS